ncbi:hypothetical protein F4859DRAFT_508782 [Xylaria cf. heliscus]|nr:hypothetical protein F4859DRAFT_508782 [Xylaria cf. heliscus]
MATRLPSALPRRPTPNILPLPLNHTSPSPSATAYQAPSHTPLSRTPSRAATLIRRPRRPYTFTQLVQQSDGSTYTMRTSSPLALYKSTKDTRNHALWNPNDKTLQNVEVDEAGKLAAFRERFGRGWDAAAPAAAATTDTDAADADAPGNDKEGSPAAAAAAAADGHGASGSGDALADLIAGYAAAMEQPPAPQAPKKEKKDKK